MRCATASQFSCSYLQVLWNFDAVVQRLAERIEAFRWTAEQFEFAGEAGLSATALSCSTGEVLVL